MYEQFKDSFDDEGVETLSSTMIKGTERQIQLAMNATNKLEKPLQLSYLIERMTKKRMTMHDEIFEPWNPFYTLLPMMELNTASSTQIEDIKSKAIEHLKYHKNKYCGWSGYAAAYPQLVPLYGLTILLGLLDRKEGYQMINRKDFYEYFLKCKNENGTLSTFPGGESDLRSTFCAVFICWMYNILTPKITHNLVEFIQKCQNYDGGFAPLPGCESHGGYTYCAVNMLAILDRFDVININKLIRWIADRQDPYSGGFSGRPNKLVDTCYCWWIGSPARTVSNHLKIGAFWNETAITNFLTQVAQGQFGGFKDRPPSCVDPFHTLWGSAGLCVCGDLHAEGAGTDESPEVEPISAIPIEQFNHMKEYFYSQPPIESEEAGARSTCSLA